MGGADDTPGTSGVAELASGLVVERSGLDAVSVGSQVALADKAADLRVLCGSAIGATMPLAEVAAYVWGGKLVLRHNGTEVLVLRRPGLAGSFAVASAARRVQSLADAARAEAETQRQVALGRDRMFLEVPATFPQEDWFTCAACGRASDFSSAADAKSLAAILLFETAEVWSSIRFEVGYPNNRPIHPSWLEVHAGLDHDTAVFKLLVTGAYGLLIQTGATFEFAPALCAPCYHERMVQVRDQLSAPPPETKTHPPVQRDPVPAQVRFHVLQRDAYRCQYCGRSARDGTVLHVDHVVPVAHGGTSTEDNLITSCDECNLGKSTTEVG